MRESGGCEGYGGCGEVGDGAEERRLTRCKDENKEKIALILSLYTRETWMECCSSQCS